MVHEYRKNPEKRVLLKDFDCKGPIPKSGHIRFVYVRFLPFFSLNMMSQKFPGHPKTREEHTIRRIKMILLPGFFKASSL